MAGHLFIVRGDLTHLASDAILIPSGTDERGRRGHTSWEVDRLEKVDGLVVGAPRRSRAKQIVGSTPTAPALWLGHTGERGDEPPSWYAAAIVEFICKAKSTRVRRGLGGDRPLLGIPLVGVGAGGRGRDKGDVVNEIVRTAMRAAADHDVDVVLVTREAADFAAAQHARATGRRDPWRGLSGDLRDVGRRLATRARTGRLVLFMGAGTGIGAGLPTWDELLRRLASRGRRSKADIRRLADLDARDAGSVIARDLDLRVAIAEEVRSDHVSLLHQLLASLPVMEAATTNYDVLFERAWQDAGREHVVLPRQSAVDAEAWLLKLHGSIDGSGDVVLSRDDYLRFEGEGVALAGVIQAMLLTRHMLFVGYSMSDDNFHRLVHQVRRAVGPADRRPDSQPFGTALTMGRNSLVESLWEGDIDLVPAGNRSVGPRRIAMMLDLVACEATTGSSHLLDDAYDAVFTEDERKLRAALREVEQAAQGADVRPALRDSVEQAIDTLRSR